VHARVYPHRPCPCMPAIAHNVRHLPNSKYKPGSPREGTTAPHTNDCTRREACQLFHWSASHLITRMTGCGGFRTSMGYQQQRALVTTRTSLARTIVVDKAQRATWRG
jgi:hypothetical protein